MAVESVAAEFMGGCARVWLNGSNICICIEYVTMPCCITATGMLCL
jgi:hypothetical protein